MSKLLQTPDVTMGLYAGKTTCCWSYDYSGTIEYRFNLLGYRSNIEFNSVPDYVFFGCSTVFGVGVAEDERFSSYFKNSYNFGIETKSSKQFGLPGPYDNYDILTTINNFNQSKLFGRNTTGMVLWTDRPGQDIDSIIQNCHVDFNLIHFKIGKYNSTLAENFKPAIDEDASGSHGGPKSHKIWFYQLQRRFQQ